MFKFSAALLEKENRAFSIIFQKSFRTEMEYVSNGKIKVTVFHPRMHKIKEFFFLELFWSRLLIHREVEFLPSYMKNYAVLLIHNCPIIHNLCLLLLSKDNFHVIIFLLVFSKPSITSFNRTSLWVAFLSKHIFQGIMLGEKKKERRGKKKKDNTKPNWKKTNPLKMTTKPLPQQHSWDVSFSASLRVPPACMGNIDCWADYHSYEREHGEMKWGGQRVGVGYVCTLVHLHVRERTKKKLHVWVYVFFATFQRLTTVPKKASAHILSWLMQ